MRKKPLIAILSNYPVWLHCDRIPTQGGHYGVWHVAMHEAFEHSDEFEIHRVVVDKNIRERVDFEDRGQFFHVLPGARKMIGLYTAYAWDRWQVSRCLKELRPDLVHGWGTETCYGLCTKDFRGKKLLSVQGLLKAYSERAELATFERRQAFYEPSVFRSMPLITTESPWARERVLELAPNAQVELFEYAVEERFFSAIRRPEETPCCLLAGSNTPVKNVPLAIRAFSRPELRHVKLYLAGVGLNDYGGLPGNIIPMGRINREEMTEMLSRVWAVVHPSLADSCPNIIKESRVVGVPAVITQGCGAKQYVIQGKSGYITEPNNEQQLVDGVLNLVKDLETSLVCGEYDRERCRKALSRQTMIDGISAIYRRILNKN